MQALTAFADEHGPFGQWLAARVRAHIPAHGHAPRAATAPLRALLPRDPTAAHMRTAWLMGTVLPERLAGCREVRTHLAWWAYARPHEEPKAIVLGIEIGVLPIGIMGKMKRKREPMTVFLRDDGPPPLHTTIREATTLTHTLVERALTMARGRTALLEPEMGDWLFGDKPTAYYRAPAAVLTDLAAHLDVLDAPYAPFAAVRDAAGAITMLATPPTVYAPDLPGFTHCIPLDEPLA